MKITINKQPKINQKIKYKDNFGYSPGTYIEFKNGVGWVRLPNGHIDNFEFWKPIKENTKIPLNKLKELIREEIKNNLKEDFNELPKYPFEAHELQDQIQSALEGLKPNNTVVIYVSMNEEEMYRVDEDGGDSELFLEDKPGKSKIYVLISINWNNKDIIVLNTGDKDMLETHREGILERNRKRNYSVGYELKIYNSNL